MNEFLRAYVECALWSSTTDDGTPMDRDHSAADLAPETLARMERDCWKFIADNAEDIGDEYSRAGHDFWLTRNRHGAGFWDGDWPEMPAVRLTESSHSFGECDLYVGNEGRLYL